MIVVFLAGLVALIMIRTLSLDYMRYTQGEGDGENFTKDDSGWKRIHGDVFRACDHLPLFVLLMGNGAHLVYTVVMSLLLILIMTTYLGRTCWEWMMMMKMNGFSEDWSLLLLL